MSSISSINGFVEASFNQQLFFVVSKRSTGLDGLVWPHPSAPLAPQAVKIRDYSGQLRKLSKKWL